jgi:hypothetical protein
MGGRQCAFVRHSSCDEYIGNECTIQNRQRGAKQNLLKGADENTIHLPCIFFPTKTEHLQTAAAIGRMKL